MAKKKRKTTHRRKSSGRRVSGIGSDLTSVGAGIVLALITDVVATKVVGGGHHGHDGGAPNMVVNADNAVQAVEAIEAVEGTSDNPVMSAIEGIGRMTGLPKDAIVKGGAALAFIVIADKMPQYRTGALIAASILGYKALTHLPMIRGHVYPMTGVTLGDINDRMQQAIDAFKAKQIEAIEGGAPIEEVYGVTLGDTGSPYNAAGQRVAGVY